MAGRGWLGQENASQRIVEAAIAAFAERGFHGTATRDIARAAGMSPAGLYVYYESKEELLYQIILDGHKALLAELRAAVNVVADPHGRLTECVRTLALWHARRHTRARVANYELAALTQEHRAEISDIRGSISSILAAEVSAGTADGLFDVPDVRMTTGALLSLSVDVSRWYSDSGRLTPEQIAEHHVALALRMVGATPCPRP